MDDKPLQEMLGVVKSVLASLATDTERCKLMREFEWREWD